MQRASKKRQAVQSRGSFASRLTAPGRGDRRTLVQQAVQATLEQLENRQLFAGDGWTATWAAAVAATNPRLVDGSSGDVIETPDDGTFQRIEASVNYAVSNNATMPAGAPANWNNDGVGNRAEFFAARWEGYVQAPASETFTLFPSTDDGARVSVSGDLSDGNPANDDLQILAPDNIGADRGNTEDTRVVPFAFVAGHFYKVRFDMNQGGGDWAAQLRWSSTSTPKAVIPQSAVYAINPTAQAAVTATAGNKAVQLSWTYKLNNDTTQNANLNQVPTSYVVKRSGTPGGPYTTVPNGTVTVAAGQTKTTQTLSFVDADPTLLNGTPYYYVVQADTNYPDAIGPNSVEVTATPVAAAPVDVPNVVGTRANGNGADVVLTITPPIATTQFNVYRADQDPATLLPAAGGFTKITATPNTGNTFTDVGRTTPAFYKVTSVNSSGESTLATAKVVFVGVGNGWSATYATAKDVPTGNPRTVDGVDASTVRVNGVFNRIDPVINVGGGENVMPVGAPANWNLQEPTRRGADFATRWEGFVSAQYNETYTFYTMTDDGARVSVEDPANPGTFIPIGDVGANGIDDILLDRGEPAAPGDVRVVPFAFQAGKQYRVRFESNQGGGGWGARLRWGSTSQPVDFVPTSQVRSLAPPPVATVATDTSFTLTPSPTSVVVTFANVAASQYKIYRSTTPNFTVGAANLITTVNASQGDFVSYTDSGLATGTTYYYKIVSVSLTGESAPSVEKSTTTVLVAPTAPTNLTIASGQLIPNAQGYTPAGSAINTTVTFDRTLFTTSYRLERANIATPTTFAPVTGGTLTDGATGGRASITDTTSALGQGYVYRVVSINSAGESTPPSATVTIDYRTGLQQRAHANQWWNSATQATAGHKTVGVAARTGFLADINYNLNDQTPPPNGTVATNNSNVWTGKIVAPETGTYQILGFSDDDSYVYVNGTLVSADPGGHGIPQNNNAVDANNAPLGMQLIDTKVPISLTAGQSYDIQVFQSQGGGGHGTILRWILPSDADPNNADLVPSSALRTSTGVPVVASNIVLTFASENSLTLQFDSTATNELRFRVERADQVSGPFTTIATAGLQDAGFGNTVFVTDPTVSAGRTYFYRVVTENYEGATVTAAVPLSTPGPVVQTGTNAHYYDVPLWGPGTRTTDSYKIPSLTAIENVLRQDNIDLAGNADTVAPPYAAAGDNGGNFSVVFTGKITTNAAQPGNTTNAPETYTFVTQSDDDSYIVVNGKLVAANPNGHADNTNALQVFTINLLPNTAYNFQYYMSQGGGGWGHHMRWKAPGDNTNYTLPGPDPVATPNTWANAPVIPLDRFTTNIEDTPAAPTVAATGAITDIGGDRLTVNFTDKANSEIKYVLQRATSAAFTDAVEVDLPIVLVPNADVDGEPGGVASPGTAASFTDTGLTPGVSYFYRLRAVNYDGVSAFVNIPGPNGDGSATTTLISTPAFLSAGPARSGEVAVEFTNLNTLATSVELQYSTDPTFAAGVTTQNVAPTAGRQRITLTGLTAGTRYYFRVRSVGTVAQGNSAYSTNASAVPNTTVPTTSPLIVDRAAGFGTPAAPTAGFQLNGTTTVTADGRLRLTNAANDQTGSAFTTTQVDVSSFIASFDLQWNANPGADGMAFVIQRSAATSIGGGGGGIGYAGIANSVAVAFDIYDNEQKVALLVNGAGFDPATELDLTAAGFNFNSGNMYHVAVSYNGTNLGLTITDTVTPATTFTTSVPLNLATTIGGTTAFVGFTGATGGANATQEILNFVFAPNTIPTGLPVWMDPASVATWNEATNVLTITGAATMIADPAKTGDDAAAVITANGAVAQLSIAPTVDKQIHFAGLTLTGGAKATVQSVGATRSPANHRLLVLKAPQLTIDATSTLDLKDNDMVLKQATAASNAVVRGLINRGFAAAAWNGTGLTSSSAAATGDTALGYVFNDGAAGFSFTDFGPGATAAEKEDVVATDMIIKYTRAGDADLNGLVNFDDYFYIDFSYPLATGSIWATGDLDYNGATNFDDYFYVDFNYLNPTPL